MQKEKKTPELKEEQKEAVFHNEGNILVSASAGSGKTHVMIERALRLIVEGRATVKEILAVTFTELAATEMKEKLKKAFIEKINEGKSYLAPQLSDIYTADISTLHSFCAKIIRRYFYAVSLAPDFSVLDESRANILKSDALDYVFRQGYEKGEESFLRLTERYKRRRSDGELKKIILSAESFIESEAQPEKTANAYKEIYSEEGFYKCLEEYKKSIDGVLSKCLAELENDKIGYVNGGENKLAELADVYIAVLKESLSVDIYKFKNIVLPKINKPKKYDEVFADSVKNFDSVKERMEDIQDRLSEVLTDIEADKSAFLAMREETEGFVELLFKYIARYSELKREENVLDFNDLEHFALKILSVEEIANEVGERYKYIFVDEYQDTNGVQEEILNKISKNNLFMVGDVKQSIYGFRGCRPDIFEQKFARMKENGEKTTELNYNFRSSKKVVDAVNQIFDFSMTEDFYGKSYKGSSELRYGGLYDGYEGRAQVHYYQKKKTKRAVRQKRGVYDVKEEFYKENESSCASDVSFAVASVIREELGKTYYDIKEKREKAIKYSDIVLLSKTNEGGDIAPVVKGLMSQGIPVSSAIKHNVCEFPEIICLINALNLIDCFRQDIPLVNVMKSPIGNFTEEELAVIATKYRTEKNDKDRSFLKGIDYFCENGEGDLREKLVGFINYFEKIRFIADFSGAKGAMERLVADADYENCLLASADGELKIKRLRKFIGETSQKGATHTVKEFLKKIEASPKSFEMAFETGENAVKSMTIHASKGLEFPVVILCGMEKIFKADSLKKALLTDRTYGIVLKNHDDDKKTERCTVLGGLVAETGAQNAMKENLRLFYVATTRAKYSLHLFYSGSAAKRYGVFLGSNRMIGFVPDYMDTRVWNEEDFEFAKLQKGHRTVIVGRGESKDIEEMRRFYRYEYPFVSDTVLPLKKSVTELNDEAKDKAERFFGLADCKKETDKSKVERKATDTEKGIVAHKILQNMDFGSDEPVKEQIYRMTERGITTAEEFSSVNVERLIGALSSDVFANLKGKTVLKEKEFLVNLPSERVTGVKSGENVLLQGVIDLLVIDGGEARVIDYKYSSANGETLKKRYGKQLELYAYAVEKVLDKKVTDKIIVNIFSGEIIK